ncbi:MAG: SelL-related redox protein [Aureispira sp.]
MYQANQYIKLDAEILEATFTNKGNSLYDIAQKSSVLLLFLRHFGCPFCNEALADIAKIKRQLYAQKIKLVFIHLADESYGKQYLKRYNLEQEEHISDPDISLYEYFDLQKGGFHELYNLKVWSRIVQLQKEYGVQLKKALGSTRQMPGVFFIHSGQIVNTYLHTTAADRPDYLAFCQQSLEKIG